MREVVLDVETTGLSFERDRVVEIGIVELFDKMPTGDYYHSYINADGQKMSAEAREISGITDEFLADKPKFKDVYNEIINFIGNSPIVAHNAQFDINMINAEFARIKVGKVKNKVIDTLQIARKLFSSGNSLDGLCKRFKIDLRSRKFHGALKDAKLLASVYFFLCSSETSLDEISATNQVIEEDFIFQKRENPSKVSLEDQEKHLKIMFQVTK